MPVYNERSTIREILARVRSVELPGLEQEIVVVDDCSTDGTGDVLEEEKAHPGTMLLKHPVNRGKGAAVQTGLQAATVT